MSATTSNSPFQFKSSDGLEALLKRNSAWAQKINTDHPNLFPTNAQGQSPHILWIGCADSRAGEACLDMLPGEVFVHRNIANVVSHSDMSVLAVLQLAVDSLKVDHIIVCGHYDCKGVDTTLKNQRLGGELDGWLRNLRQIRSDNNDTLAAIADHKGRCKKLVELNVIAQVKNVRRNDRVAAATKERGLQVHGVAYDCATGLLNEIPVENEHFHESVWGVE
jgi:carbonic anhydrase